MNHESAVQFPTNSRIHMGLAVRNLERSLAFYRTLFGHGPTKTRPRYAKFEVAELPVNLALNEVGGDTGPNNPVAHFGIQVKSSAAVAGLAAAQRQAGRGRDGMARRRRRRTINMPPSTYRRNDSLVT